MSDKRCSTPKKFTLMFIIYIQAKTQAVKKNCCPTKWQELPLTNGSNVHTWIFFLSRNIIQVAALRLELLRGKEGARGQGKGRRSHSRPQSARSALHRSDHTCECFRSSSSPAENDVLLHVILIVARFFFRRHCTITPIPR